MPNKLNTESLQYLEDLKQLRDDIVEIARELELDWELAYQLVLLSWVRAQPTQKFPPKSLG